MGIVKQELAQLLEQLYSAAGSPSYPSLEGLGAPPKSTISDWMTGKSAPREIDQLLRLVSAIAASAPDLPAELLESRRWRAVLSNARASEATARIANTSAALSGLTAMGERNPFAYTVSPMSETDRSLPSHWQNHATWFLHELRADINPRICLVGAVDSGKSTFFRLLARGQPHESDGVSYAYWMLTEDRDAVSDVGFWAQVSHRLGLTETLEPRSAVRRLPEALAELHSDGPIRTVVLVLDDWDYAQAHADGFVHAASMSRLVRLVHSDQMLVDRPVRLGLCYITRFPSMQYLTLYARRTDTREVTRLSQDLPERGFVQARFPFLDQESALGLLRELGSPPESHEQLLDACGGWVGLLVNAARHLDQIGQWGAEVEHALRDDLEHMLLKSLLPEVMSQTRAETPEAAWAKILRGLDAGHNPETRYALPSSFEHASGSRRLPGLLRTLFAPPVFLVVDLENLCMRYQKHAEREPAAYPDGLSAFWRDVMPRAIEHAAEAFDVEPTNVLIAAKSKERAHDVLGPLPPGWRVLAPDLRLERGHQSEADDKVADAFIAQQAAAHPASRVVLLTEDQENLGVLKPLGIPHLVIWTPFEAPRGIARYTSDTWTVRDHLLSAVGAFRPPIKPSV